ncbi:MULTISPECIES: response regulator transcription factor [unclassified Olleya]|jgi:DNA-binding NarL/FixJ family response regulator|uniref:response regulator transcription factor n=1 Tax=unclassified Olleya TaxID=2615019 RepID=UPI0011A38E2A|nr:response regulator transcription factor [Olleya sp. Hel_I_94]TVZ46264.1 DNA-binding NarL/FixJ family response regulator [Olleya sp. Hel_I_94]|tara:strand:+ start:9505 stop:10170 length:666 start_codon:yes stop_codon:yes gene_type:complete
MFSKVIISDDLGSISQGVLSVLSKLSITNVTQVQYCDDAYLKISKAILDQQPFELLITDLSFIADHRDQKYKSGEELVAALKQQNPDLKIIVYSVEDRLQKVRVLVNKHNIDGYVCKGRRGLIELDQAIVTTYQNGQYLSPQVQQALSPKSNLEIDDYDILLIKLLSNGLSQEQIREQLKIDNISPNSLSTIEKKLNKLRIQFKANNAIHLVAIVKDLGLI